MPEPKRSPAPAFRNPYSEALDVIVGGVIIAGLFYEAIIFVASFFPRPEYPTVDIVLKVVRYGATIFFLGIFIWGAVRRFSQARKAARAREASKQVAAALNEMTDQSPGRNIAEISTEKVAESLKNTNIGAEQLTRLVDQRKQQLLIDDEYVLRELSTLIVDYLQPLPRNAKRLLNRFRVNLLIAHSRALFTSEPKVTTQQIGKWLVLMERWPQLGRSLSAVPAKMKTLEDQSNPAAPSEQGNSQSDPFMELVKTLAPPYFGDEDLRKFVHSKPSIWAVAQRLIHYGAHEPPPPPPGASY
jgi:hypothetical protein